MGSEPFPVQRMHPDVARSGTSFSQAAWILDPGTKNERRQNIAAPTTSGCTTCPTASETMSCKRWHGAAVSASNAAGLSHGCGTPMPSTVAKTKIPLKAPVSKEKPSPSESTKRRPPVNPKSGPDESAVEWLDLHQRINPEKLNHLVLKSYLGRAARIAALSQKRVLRLIVSPGCRSKVETLLSQFATRSGQGYLLPSQLIGRSMRVELEPEDSQFKRRYQRACEAGLDVPVARELSDLLAAVADKDCAHAEAGHA